MGGKLESETSSQQQADARREEEDNRSLPSNWVLDSFFLSFGYWLLNSYQDAQQPAEKEQVSAEPAEAAAAAEAISWRQHLAHCREMCQGGAYTDAALGLATLIDGSQSDASATWRAEGDQAIRSVCVFAKRPLCVHHQPLLLKVR